METRNEMKKKQTIRLNESQLRRIVKEAVKRILNENIDKSIKEFSWEIGNIILDYNGDDVKFGCYCTPDEDYCVIKVKAYQRMGYNELVSTVKNIFSELGVDQLANCVFDKVNYHPESYQWNLYIQAYPIEN